MPRDIAFLRAINVGGHTVKYEGSKYGQEDGRIVEDGWFLPTWWAKNLKRALTRQKCKQTAMRRYVWPGYTGIIPLRHSILAGGLCIPFDS